MSVEREIMMWVVRIDLAIMNCILPALVFLVGFMAIPILRWGNRRWQRRKADFKPM